MRSLDKIFDRPVKLPAISQAVHDLIDMTKRPDADLNEIVKLVRLDQTLAAKVLRIANSSYFGERGRVASIERAINIIGLQTLRTTVLMVGLMNAFPAVSGINLQDYWHHSLTTAFMSVELAEKIGANSEDAFTAGLMRGLGVLLIHVCLTEEAHLITESVSPLNFVDRMPVERKILGFTHNEAGAELLSRWNFPAHICSAVKNVPHSNEGGQLSNIVGFATEYASLMASSSDKDIAQASLIAQLRKHFNIDQDWFTQRCSAVETAVESIVRST